MKYAYLILIAFVVIYFVITIRGQKKMMQANQEKISQIKIGEKVKTTMGIYGTLVGTYETTDGKIAKLNISEDSECIIEVNFRCIIGVDNKKMLELDENNNVVKIDGIPVDEYEKENNENPK